MRKTVLVMAFLVMCLCISACAEQVPQIEWRPHDVVKNEYIGNVQMVVERPKKKEDVSVELKNNTEQALYDISFYLEKLNENGWEIRSWDIPADGDELARYYYTYPTLYPEETLETSVSVYHMVGSWEQGHYRIHCIFSFAPNEVPENKFSLYYEFDMS